MSSDLSFAWYVICSLLIFLCYPISLLSSTFSPVIIFLYDFYCLPGDSSNFARIKSYSDLTLRIFGAKNMSEKFFSYLFSIASLLRVASDKS